MAMFIYKDGQFTPSETTKKELIYTDYTVIKENVDKELEQNLLEHENLIKLLNQYTKYQVKKRYKVLADIKKNNKRRKELCDIGKRIEKELKYIQQDIEKLNKSAGEIYTSNVSDYNILKSFCFDFEKRFLKKADKRSMDIYFKAKKEFKELGDKIDCDLKNSVDSAMLYQKLFKKDENCFNIIKGLEMIEKNKYALSVCDILSDDEKRGYEKIFSDNEKFMRGLLDKRFEKIKEKIENSQNLSKDNFLFKEYQKAISYLNIDIEISKNNDSNSGGYKKAVYQSVEQKSNNYVVIDVGGIGYKIFMATKAIETLGEIGEIVKVHTHYYVREDNISLYGFNTNEELRIFE